MLSMLDKAFDFFSDKIDSLFESELELSEATFSSGLFVNWL